MKKSGCRLALACHRLGEVTNVTEQNDRQRDAGGFFVKKFGCAAVTKLQIDLVSSLNGPSVERLAVFYFLALSAARHKYQAAVVR